MHCIFMIGSSLLSKAMTEWQRYQFQRSENQNQGKNNYNEVPETMMFYRHLSSWVQASSESNEHSWLIIAKTYIWCLSVTKHVICIPGRFLAFFRTRIIMEEWENKQWNKDSIDSASAVLWGLENDLLILIIWKKSFTSVIIFWNHRMHFWLIHGSKGIINICSKMPSFFFLSSLCTSVAKKGTEVEKLFSLELAYDILSTALLW